MDNESGRPLSDDETEASNNSTVKGVKYSSGKRAHHLLPWSSINQVADVLTYGAIKYGGPDSTPRNWELGISYSDLFRASIGHMTDWYNGVDKDSESSLPHLAHAACNILMIMHLINAGMDSFDDRPLKITGETLDKILREAEESRRLAGDKQAEFLEKYEHAKRLG